MEFEGSKEFQEKSESPPTCFTIIIQRFDIDGEELIANGTPERRVAMCINKEDMENKINDILQQQG